MIVEEWLCGGLILLCLFDLFVVVMCWLFCCVVCVCIFGDWLM